MAEGWESAYDAIVVGAGHNGLAAAIRLADKGWRVLVVDGHAQAGGAIKTRELTLPGYRHDVAAMNLSLFAGSAFFREYRDRLMRHGLAFVPAAHGFGSVFPDGGFLGVSRDMAQTRASLAAISPRDADAWADMVAAFAEDAPHMRAILDAPMPSWGVARAVMRAWRKKGTGWLCDMLRLALATPRDFLESRFEHPHTQAMLAIWGLYNDFPPDCAGGALSCYFPTLAAQCFGVVFGRGGADTVINAMVGTLREAGGELILGDRVTGIEIDSGAATGVTLASGRRFGARRIIANVNPKLVFRDLIPASNAPPDYARAIARMRPGPSTFMLHLALGDRVPWRAAAARDFAYVHVAPDLQMMSRAFAEAAAGLLPVEPAVVVGQATAIDPSRAPPGKHILWVQARVVPSRIKGDAAGIITASDWSDAGGAFADRMLDILERHAPGMRGLILDRALHSPLDLERENPSMIGGDSLGGSHHLDQNYFMRPIAGWSRYRTPIRNLFLCGASTWPGAGTGAGSGFMLARMLAG